MSICQIYDLCAETLWLGRYGENGARDIAIDVGRWFADLGAEGTVVLVNWRPGEDDAPYNPNITMDGSKVVWSPNSIDLAISGRGFAELRYYVGNALAKSKTFRTVIDRTPSEGANPPSAAEDWLERMEDAAVTAQTASETAVAAAETATEGAQAVAQAAATATSAAATATNAATEAALSEEVASTAANAAQAASETATAASQTAVSASGTATTKASQASASASTAATAATTATTKASEATTAATTATTKAGEASTSASTATSAKDTAVSASQTATSKATEATTAAATATSASTTATTAKDDAVSAKTAAQTAQTGAETAAASVSASAEQIATNAADISQLKSDLNEITVYSDDYTLLEPIKTVSGKYVFNNTYNNKLNEVSDSSMGYKVYAIEAGQKYEIYGFGYDRYQFYMAVLGDNSEVMVGTTAVSNFIENVLCGTDVYPSGYTYHTVTKTFETNGYLFVNYKVAQSEAACSAAQKRAKVDTAITESVDVRGIEKRGNQYYHFSKLGDDYLIRRFTNMGGNNLFQWAGIALGKLTSSGVSITQTIINYDTDIIGPITIFNTALFPNQYGQWTGGNHTKIVNGTAYPTAVQESLKILVNGKEITDDGVYYGDVKFISVNSLYFPQSITGADLSTATKAITETREYSIDKQLHVRVRLNFVETVRVSLYYGMQAVISPYNNILFANNEYYGVLPNASNINFSNKEHEVIMTANDGMRLIASLRDIGLGTFNHNDGSTGYATLPASSVTRKLYYRLIDGASSQGFSNGDVLMWEGCYSVDII